jgi:calcium-dependent protein kinase
MSSGKRDLGSNEDSGNQKDRSRANSEEYSTHPPTFARQFSRQTSYLSLQNYNKDIRDFYLLGEQIGEPGNFGKAVIATHKEEGTKYACKVISKARFSCTDEQRVSAFKNEIRVMTSLDHPNIIQLKEVFEDAANLYIVMELCTGGELFARIQEQGAYGERDAAGLIIQMCRALHHMHIHNVAHCDLKPDNFLFLNEAKDSPLKIIDFGLSKFVKKRKYFTAFVGTPYYCAPEVLEGKYNQHCDMWSIGVVAFVLLFGYPPFYADPKRYGNKTDRRIFEKIRSGFDPSTRKGYGSHFPKDLPISSQAKAFIAKLLTHDVSERMTAEEALNHPWLKSEIQDGQLLDPLVLSGLQSFQNNNKLKLTILNLFSDAVADDEVKRLQATFRQIDKDNSSAISKAELREALMSFELLASAHEDEEKETHLASPTNNTSRERAHSRSRGLSLHEMTLENKKMQKSVEERVNRIFELCDLDGDGIISYDEVFLSLLNKKICVKVCVCVYEIGCVCV